PPVGWPRYVRPVCPPRKVEEARVHVNPGLFFSSVQSTGGLRFREFVIREPDQRQAIPDVADRADEILVVNTELGAEAPGVQVYSSGATVVVVAPDFGQQLLAGKHASGVLSEVLEELEFLERQVQGLATDPGRVARFIDHGPRSADLRLRLLFAWYSPGHGQTDSGFDLSRAGRVQHDVIH